MGEALADRLRGRFLFVVGKGGVGKTTTASSAALHFADQGELTHVISTDPAHSLADVLDQQITNSLTTSSCTDRLRIEQFDAKAYADEWLKRGRDALVQIVERGTYLDAGDAASFLDLSLPGVDEVMSALRLVELRDQSDLKRIVVDTAPTGHTLRLLDADQIIDSWANALRAMIDKADAVAHALLGRAPDWPAVALLEDWRARATRFRDLLSKADFVVVTRDGTVVTAETERLVQSIQQRSLRLTAVVSAAGTAPLAEWVAPEFPDRPRGCAPLRNWWRSVTPSSHTSTPDQPDLTEPAPRQHESEDAVAWVESLTQPLLLVAGKGGVGKSTVAAAIALLRAESRGACLVSTDPAGSLADVLELPVTAEASEPVPGLRVWQMDARREYEKLRGGYSDEVRAVFERLGLDESIRLDRQVIERLWNLAPPGIDEIVALTEMLAAVESCSSTVLDSAPTGHFLRLVAMPATAVEWSHALMRFLLKYRVAGALEQFTREVLNFARRTRELQEMLTSAQHTGAFIVSLDQPVVWAETLRLHAALRDAKIPVAALVINRADAGPHRGHPEFANARIIRAPQLDTPPVGPAALRNFLGRWELVSCPT